MAKPRKITDTEWDMHRSLLQSLYENHKLEEIISIMKEQHAFEASKAQYVRQFEKWRFQKNLKEAYWKAIGRLIEKRKHAGKDGSVVVVNGNKVPVKKLRKELSRHCLIFNAASPPFEHPASIVVRTPSPALLTKSVVDLQMRIPWFEFEALVEPHLDRLTKLFTETQLTQPPQRGPSTLMLRFHTLMRSAGQKANVLSDCAVSTTDSLPETPSLLFHNPSTSCDLLDQDSMDNSSLDIDDAHESLSKCFRACDMGNYCDLSQMICPAPSKVYYGQNRPTMVALDDFAPTKTEAFSRMFKYLMFLASNNMITTEATDDFLRWIHKTNLLWLLNQLMELRSPTTDTFGPHVLVSAARLGNLEAVRLLLLLGTDVNSTVGGWIRTTALCESLRGKDANTVLCLLDARADPRLGHSVFGSTLELAVTNFTGSVRCKILEKLIMNGADVNERSDRYSPFYHTLLAQCVSTEDESLVEFLLNAGADPNTSTVGFVTALQVAASRGHARIVQLLVAHGAYVDAPTGPTFQEERAAYIVKHSVELLNRSPLGDLRTPLERASAIGHDATVRTLLSANANPNASAWMGYVTGANSADWASRHYVASWQDTDVDVDPPRTALQAAVEYGDEQLVRTLLMAGSDVNASVLGYTALHSAVSEGDESMILLLCESGAQPSDASWQEDIESVLETAARKQPKHVGLLLQMGADATTSDHRHTGKTALQWAASHGDIEVARALISAGADVNAPARRDGGRTCLQAATESGHLEMVSWLLNVGANVNAPPAPIHGRTALQAAAGAAGPDVTRTLINAGADVNALPSEVDGQTALQAAIEDGSDDVTELLLMAGADVNLAPSPIGGLSVLSIAIHRHRVEQVQLFLRLGARHADAGSQPIPLALAAAQGSRVIVTLLLQAGADVNATVDEEDFGAFASLRGASPLDMAVAYGHLEIAKMLLNAGSRVGGALGTTLAMAIDRESTDLVRLLITAGANPDGIKDLGFWEGHHGCGEAAVGSSHRYVSEVSNGNILVMYCSDCHGPLRKAAALGNVETVRLLLEAGARDEMIEATYGGALRAAVTSRSEETVQLLIQSGADVNKEAEYLCYRTALQTAAYDGSLEIVQLLVQSGADVNAEAADEDGGTALQLATKCGDLEVVDYLISEAADVNAEAAEKHGRTALQFAAECANLELFDYLISKGADVNARPARINGVTALAAASTVGHLRLVVTLLQAGAHINGPISEESGQSALDAAAKNGRLDVVHLLVRNDHDEGLEHRCQQAAESAAEGGHSIIARFLREYESV